MDEMFVPYKSTLEVPESSSPALGTSWSQTWIWVTAITFCVLLVGAFLVKNSFKLEKQAAPPAPIKTPNVALIPPVIDFSVPAKLNTESMSKEELAKFVGTELKNLLVLYSGVSSLQTASIVSFAVRTMLEDFAPVLQPQGITEKKPVLEKLDEEFISTKVLQPRPQSQHKQDAIEEEETKDPPKKGKINADTDANLLFMLKQRGLSN